MLKVALVRGKYLNNFEGQNYIFNPEEISITAISSLTPIHDKYPFNHIKLPSIADLTSIPILNKLAFFNKMIKYLSNRTLGDMQNLFGLEKYQNDFDIFHAADPHYYYSYQFAKLRKKDFIKKLILTSWEVIPFNNESVLRKKFIKYFSLKYADYFICYTDKAKEVLIKEGVNPAKIKVISLGVDLNRFKPADKKDKKNLTILFIGRLVEEKGVMDLYRAFKTLTKESKNKYKLRIIGDGPLKSKLINNVAIESKNYEDLAEIYQGADIFVLPSKKTKTWEEQYGMVLIEAMASGLPIITYDSGAIPELIGDAGIIINKNYLTNLIRILKRLANDKNLRAKLGFLSRKRAKKYFDAKKTADKISKLYNIV